MTKQRLDKMVAERFGLSRRAAREAILTGKVDLAGHRCDEPGEMIEPDADVAFFPNRPKERKVFGREAISVLYEDPHVIIVDKPAGLLTLPTAASEPDTLASRVERYLTIRHGGRPYVGIIHRLDAMTSGALALARSSEAVDAFKRLFHDHEIERQYLAVVEGACAWENTTIDLPLVTDEGPIRRRLAHEPGEGRRAVTHVRRIEQFGRVATLVACRLETGRTHQVRLHLAAVGYPVLGDRVYRPRSQPRCKAQFHRQALHAQALGFVHPMTGVEIRVEAALPSDMAGLLLDLRNRFGSASVRG